MIHPFITKDLEIFYEEVSPEDRKKGIVERTEDEKKILYSKQSHQAVVTTVGGRKILFETRVFVSEDLLDKFGSEDFAIMTEEKLILGFLPFAQICGLYEADGKTLITKLRIETKMTEIKPREEKNGKDESAG